MLRAGVLLLLLEFTYCNDIFPMEVTAKEIDKYVILQPQMFQQGS